MYIGDKLSNLNNSKSSHDIIKPSTSLKEKRLNTKWFYKAIKYKDI